MSKNTNDVLRDDTWPLAYLITYHTYGTWLHGDNRGSVDRLHNLPDTEFVPIDQRRLEAGERHMCHEPLVLNGRQREIVADTVREVAQHRDWTVHALNVRTNHVHIVVTAGTKPEKVMGGFKSWCTRRMVEAGLIARGGKVWTRHGSTRYLWSEQSVEQACRYVIEGQGEPLVTERTEPRP